MKKNLFTLFTIIAALICSINSNATALDSISKNNFNTPLFKRKADADLKLPQGFNAVKVADDLGKARHLAVNKQGDIIVKIDKIKGNNGIVILKDLNKDGIAEKQIKFGNFSGTGMAIKDNYLYASSDEEVFRFKLDNSGQVINQDKPEKIITGLVNRRAHSAKAITLDNNGHIYVNVGAYSNACQVQDRAKGSPGQKPCPILDSAGGIWQFSANKLNQTYKDGVRYATGLRNVVGLDWNNQINELFVMQHGRDQLHDLFPDMYDTKTSAVLPAEAMYMVKKGDDCGWPYIYYDQFQKKKILAPEYGGDGKKTAGENAIDPVAAFPGHMGPNGLLFYTGNAFPKKYKNGAFVAFHGSWNRAPEKQEGFFVVFVPFQNGKPAGDWEVFADGFAGSDNISSPGQAEHRPCGLAQGPDGSLYVSDDAKGTIYKISYNDK